MLVGPAPANNPGSSTGHNPYSPKRPILVNTIKGNPTYSQAVVTANNIYTSADNYCFWDNGNSAVNGIGEKSGNIINFLNTGAGNLEITVNSNGTLSFVKASATAAAKG
ncbi:MAG TPA: hypothetical protein VE959_14675 [Bryobacteraceae bacterium]|nr:hypothetical protein [Bryobacteraceae bacterium]